MQTQRQVANPFSVYNRMVASISSASGPLIDSIQAVFNVTGALTATTALGTTALALAPPIGVAVACLGAVAYRVYALVRDNEEFKEIMDDLLFVMQKIETVNPCPFVESETDTCRYVKRHLIQMTEILNLFLRLPEKTRIKTLTPAQFTNQLLREFTLMNAGLSVILLEAKFQTPVDAIAVQEVTGEKSGGGAINYNDPAFAEQVNKLMSQINKNTDDIVIQNAVATEGGRRTRHNKRRKNRRTIRNRRR